MLKGPGRTHNQLKSMTRPNKFLTTAGSFLAALSALAVITSSVGVQAEDEKQPQRYQQSYCNSSDATRSCR